MDMATLTSQLSIQLSANNSSPIRFGNCRTKSTLNKNLRFRPHYCFANLNPDNTFEPKPTIPQTQPRMFFLGMGFVAQFFAPLLKNQNWAVSGTCTSLEKKTTLEKMGFDIYLFNADDDPDLTTLNALKSHTHLLVSVPPAVSIGDPVLLHRELLQSTLVDGNLEWLGYLSSTSVYGSCGGRWVNEDYPTSPTNELGKLRLLAEERWLNLGHDLGISAQVFRLGGIYGPGRSAVDTIIKQEPLSEGQKLRASRQYTSRVHVGDICQAVWASMQKPSSGKVYNIVDDDPAPREEVFQYAHELVEKKWPGLLKQSTRESSAEVKMNKAESGSSRGAKRVSNARMKEELGVKLLHSSYRSGLQSIVDHLENPSQGV